MVTQRKIVGTFIRRKTQVGGPLNYAIIKARVAVICANAVDVKVYDTDLDSDEGAWRTGALALASSWYSETLNTATRGARDEFPEVAVIVAEANKVTIYDGDDPTLPMWMVFNKATRNFIPIYAGSGDVTSIHGLNGELAVGVADDGIQRISFLEDTAFMQSTSYTKAWNRPMSGRNDNTVTETAIYGIDIVNKNVNDVAMTVLPDAPIDPATGIETPTIDVFTSGGLSRIQDNGVVVDVINSAGPTTYYPDIGDINTDNRTAFHVKNASGESRVDIGIVPSSDVSGNPASGFKQYDNTGIPPLAFGAVSSISATVSDWAIGKATGLNLIAEDTTTPANGMVAYITYEYNTGWMQGDIKGAWLSSTDDTDLVGTELVPDLTTYADQAAAVADGWVLNTGWTFDAANDEFDCDGTQVGISDLERATTFTGGGLYEVTLDVTRSAGTLYPKVGDTTGTGISSTGSFTQYIVAGAGANLELRADVNFIGSVKLIAIRLADEDRSVNANGLAAYGTITKTPVADGAELVAYSGFSASNYLEQPYNADLDFGTGDFYVMGWVKTSTIAKLSCIARYDDTSASPDWEIRMLATTGYPAFVVNGSEIATGSVSIADGAWHFICAVRDSGTLYLYVDGVPVDNGALAGSLTNTDAVLSVGGAVIASVAYNPWNDAIALVHIGATAPSAAQITKIYNDELPLFQEKAACTLAGSSDAVTALSHDQDISHLHVSQSDVRSVFKGLRRAYTEADTFTAAVDVSGGVVLGN